MNGATTATTKKNTKSDDFEFDCPQFTDFTKKQENVSEEFCQHYFDKKYEEIKRNSNEFKKENMMESDEDETSLNTPSNLLTPDAFANISSISSKSSGSQPNYYSNLYGNTSKINKNRNQLTTEEMELIKLEQKKVELEKIKEKNAKHVAKMREDHHVFHPKLSTKLTIPITPALHTTIRAKQRLKKEKKNSKHITNNNKNKKTSIRTRKHSSTTTIPQSFKLSKTKKRRNTSILSTEQKQLNEIEKHGSFQARKINPKIFKANAGNLGILNNIKNKRNTTIEPFNLMTEKRAQKYNATEKSINS